jgi:hypothetical protein
MERFVIASDRGRQDMHAVNDWGATEGSPHQSRGLGIGRAEERHDGPFEFVLSQPLRSGDTDALGLTRRSAHE